MVIIFEGLDNTGKDTQIKLLLKYLIDKPTHIIHCTNITGITNEQSEVYLKSQYLDLFKLIRESLHTRNFIFNRFLFGENVYAQKYRGYDGSYIFNIEKNNIDILDNFSLITLVDNYENLILREDNFSLSKCKKDNIQYELEMFSVTHDKSKIKNKLFLNIADKTIENVHNKIINFLGV